MFCFFYGVLLSFSMSSTTFAATKNLWGFQDINFDRIKKPPTPILIAIIDTGIDSSHPALKDCLWRNPNEIPDNGIDDDQNGFVDDLYGWDFAKANGTPFDNHGHGTHIAGLIHKIAPEAKLMVLKYYDPQVNAPDTVRFTVAAFHYARLMGAKIINYSGGGNSQSREEFQALDLARKQGILVVAAAGNDGQNSDQKPYYPADYELSNILSITAHNPQHELLPTSNYGLKSVDLSAPGENIFSLLPGGVYGEMTGTSQATALATGVAALTLSQHRELTSPEELIHHLIQTGAVENKQSGKTLLGRRLDAYRALALHDSDQRQPSSAKRLQQTVEQLLQVLRQP